MADVVEMVRNGGDEAVRRLTLRLDGVDVAEPRVPAAAVSRGRMGLAPPVRDALELLAAQRAHGVRRADAAPRPG